MRQAMLPPRAVLLMDKRFTKRFDLWRALAFRMNALVARSSTYTDVLLQYFPKYMAVIIKIHYYYQQPLRVDEVISVKLHTSVCASYSPAWILSRLSHPPGERTERTIR